MTSPSRLDWEKLDADGYLALEGLVPAKQVAAMKQRLQTLLDSTPQSHAGTLIVAGLLAEPVFDAAWNHPRVLAAVEHVLAGSVRLWGVSSRGLRPKHGQQGLHVDWATLGIPGVSYGCHVICALVDFTPENGATRVIPGSHRNPWAIQKYMGSPKPHPAERRLVGPAGTIFLMNIHCVHSAVENHSSEPRHAIFANFSRRDSPLLTADAPPEPDPEILARFPPATRAVLV
jgi:ectoine hydroxylase-related dioxygenase (phytanoyl-CoA dioxygenase family)